MIKYFKVNYNGKHITFATQMNSAGDCRYLWVQANPKKYSNGFRKIDTQIILGGEVEGTVQDVITCIRDYIFNIRRVLA